MTFRGNHVDELISASLTGDLADAERAQLDAHLARCETCRATLAAFTAERRILSGLPVADPPRDLSARVRAGIESGRLGPPWWRRPGGLIAIGASVATAAAAVLAIVVFGNFQFGPTGQQSSSPEPSGSVAPEPSAVETAPASVAPSVAPPAFLGPGQLGYLELTGAPFEALSLKLVNDATGISRDAGGVSSNVSGPVLKATLSPGGEWLVFITQKGETGANEVWAANLVSGRVAHLGCSLAAPFTDRLLWSPDGRYLAYTLVGVDLGPDSGCETPSEGADVWLFDTSTSNAVWFQFTTVGNAYAAAFASNDATGYARLWVSFAMEQPQSALLFVRDPLGRVTGEQAPGAFLPLLSPDGNRALFWSGTMAESNGVWQFALGGMPQLSGDFRSAGAASPWIGTPLFSDLTTVGGEAFAYGSFTWGPDSDLVAFWDGAWTGAPQSADGTYPSQQDVYVGRISEGLSKASKLSLIRPDDSYIVDVAFSPDGLTVAVTIGLPSAGIGDPPSAFLEIVPLDGSAPHSIGGGTDPPPWDGPAVYGR